MSVEQIALVLNHSQAVGTEKVLLLGIANHDGDGGAWPSIATLVRYAGISERNVQKALTRLVEAGELRIHVQRGGTLDTPAHMRTNRYEILVTCPAECDRTAQHRTTPPVTSDTPPPVASDTPPVSPATPEPSFEPSEELSFPDPDVPEPRLTLVPDPAPAAKVKRACQLPASWMPNDGHLAYVIEHGLDGGHQLAQFRDHHTAKGSKMKDWDAAFRTWLRNAVSYGQGRATPAPAASADPNGWMRRTPRVAE